MTNNQSTLQINFEKLYNIPYIKQFDQELFQKEVNEAVEEWIPHEQWYHQVALIRAMECTNGCVQYAFRDGEDYALPLEQTRACMKLSMGFILSKRITFPDGKEVVIDESLIPMLNKVRQLYYNGFKLGDKDALRQFYAHSVAMFNLIGHDQLEDAMFTIQEHYKDVFTPFFITYGLGYMLQFLEANEPVQEKLQGEV